MSRLEQIRNQYNLSENEKERYRQKGEDFFSNFDFKNGKMITQLDLSAKEIIGSLKSGFPIEELTQDELNILKNVYGEDWKKELELK